MSRSVCIRISSKDDGQVLVPWTFVNFNHVSYTANELLNDILLGRVSSVEVKTTCKNYKLHHGIASSSFNSTEGIKFDGEQNLVEKVDIFETRFFGLVISHKEDCEICSSQVQIQAAKPNAFEIMLAAAREQQSENVPRRYSSPGTKKEELHNKVLDWFQENCCEFPRSVPQSAKSFVAKICNIAWYLDGHHGKIEGTLPSKFPKSFKNLSGFNLPELSKHRKRSISNISENKLKAMCIELREVIQSLTFLNNIGSPWNDIKCEIIQAICTAEENKGHLKDYLLELNKKVESSELFTPVSVRECLPAGTSRQYAYLMIEELKSTGLKTKSVLYTYYPGGPKQALHFIWKIENGLPESELLNRCTALIKKIENDMPKFLSRLRKREFKHMFGFCASPVALRAMFRNLTSDCSATSDIDKRFDYAVRAEDAGIIVDLRNVSPERKKDTFAQFFQETERYLSEDVGVTVNDRRHGEQLYLAKALSFTDLHKRVAERLPEGTPTPSVKWLRYQFQPLNPNAVTAKYFKGTLNIKMMVQKRQVRVNHVDSHYCAAMWRYMREFAVMHRDVVELVSMDDKHKIKVGEPNYPLAAAQRGKQVLVGVNQTMAVGDHDFSKSTLTPSVNLIIDIPETINGSFYRGNVYVAFKDAVFEPSSPLRHSSELLQILQERGESKPVLLLYTDGGPDHRSTYMSVKLALIALFKALDLDMLIALRTAPSNSWANPVERVMSIINIGLQGVGVMREKMSPEFERAAAKANSVKEMRKQITDNLKEEFHLSLRQPIDLLKGQMLRLGLKEKPLQTFEPSTEDNINELWQHCLAIQKELQRGHTTQKDVKDLSQLQKYLKHCCIQSHYGFQIKKCGNNQCEMCGALKDERTRNIKTLPFPVLSEDKEHYKKFEQVYGTKTTEARPSLKVRTPKEKKSFHSPHLYSMLETLTQWCNVKSVRNGD
ncbi:uncharacterized protein LOC114539744 [Dendronephthya gigantea]|uniref:uncharacterized protein LOC114539744 n=1 Tax=Dendronephthya gigantea TaxID=151771 RepID=UPI00106C8307|nr:uncharacterized protein LOC114539744 [Dendronephthya gigantea]